MKKNHIIVTLLFITLPFISISCENFLQGNDIKKQIDELTWLSDKERPTAKILSPVSAPEGDYKNSSIIIKFSQSMDTSSLNGFSVTDSAGNSLRDYYSFPKWNEEATQVTFTALETNLLPISAGSYMDIIISLNKNIKNKDKVPLDKEITESYKLNSKLDKEAPYFVKVNAAIEGDILYKEIIDKDGNIIDNPDLFIEGELNSENQDLILTKNHISHYFFLDIQAHDYGDNTVFANISYKRVFDTNGNAVNEESISFKQELLYKDDCTLNRQDTSYIDLWDWKLSDGIYKIDIKLSDAANNISEETKSFYVVRDTNIFLNPDGLVQTYIPSWREGDNSEDAPAQLYKINNWERNLFLHDISDDVYITFNGKTYSTPMADLKYNISYGLSEYDPDMKTISIPEVDLAGSDRIIFVFLPDEFIEYRKANINADIYAQIEISDVVGNTRNRRMFFPKQAKFFGTTYNDENKTISLKFDDHSNFMNPNNKLDNITAETRYRIFYAEKDNSTPIPELTLKRNNSKPISDDEWDQYSDKTDFTINQEKNYIAIIIPIYTYMQNERKVAESHGLPLLLDNISKNSSITQPIQPTITDINTIPGAGGLYSSGTTDIEIQCTLTNEADVSYYYGWSTDKNNWSYFETNTFTVPTPITPPSALLDKTLNQDFEDLVKNITLGNMPEYESKGYVKVCATNGLQVIESDIKEITFKSKENDNVPPKVDPWIKNHNMTMNPDGRSFFTNNTLLSDEAYNDARIALYHYTPYSSLWGNSISFYSVNEIQGLPYSYCIDNFIDVIYEDNTKNKIVDRRIAYQVPVNGLPDGQYMFFYNYNDNNGNNVTGTLGKVNIETYKNKLKVYYHNNIIKTELEISGNEHREYNKLLLQKAVKEDINSPQAYWSTCTDFITDYFRLDDPMANFIAAENMTQDSN